MYTSFVGKKFLKLWNQRMGRNLTACEFFDEVFYPIFFKDQPHLMHVTNSPFFNKLSKEDLASGLPESEIRRKNLHRAVKEKKPNASFFVGYGAEDDLATTSGQMTNMPGRGTESEAIGGSLFEGVRTSAPMKIEEEDMYASWIGAGLGTGISGGIYWLFDREELLWALFEGWQVYRKYLHQTPHLKGRQIEIWNGHWLAHRLNGGDEHTLKIEPERRTTPEGNEQWVIPSLLWTKLLFALCRKYPDQKLLIYAYNFGQTNLTLGFLQVNLPEVHRMYELRDKIFFDKAESGLTDHEIAQLEPYYTFKSACDELGSIGLKSIKPKKLSAYLPPNYQEKMKANDQKKMKADDQEKRKDFDFRNKKIDKSFYIFKLWICAMINKKELLQLAEELAAILVHYEQDSSDRGKTKEERLTEQVRSANNVKTLADRLSELIEQTSKGKFSSDKLSKIRTVVHEAIKIPADHVPLFMALLRFEYAYLKATSH
jgi:hypothetical protein